MKKYTKAQLAALEESGAKITVTKPAAKPPPKSSPVEKSINRILSSQNERQDKIMSEIAAQFGSGQEKLVEKMTEILQKGMTTGSTAYRFNVVRDSDGLMEYVDAVPLDMTKH